MRRLNRIERSHFHSKSTPPSTKKDYGYDYCYYANNQISFEAESNKVSIHDTRHIIYMWLISYADSHLNRVIIHWSCSYILLNTYSRLQKHPLALATLNAENLYSTKQNAFFTSFCYFVRNTTNKTNKLSNQMLLFSGMCRPLDLFEARENQKYGSIVLEPFRFHEYRKYE